MKFSKKVVSLSGQECQCSTRKLENCWWGPVTWSSGIVWRSVFPFLPFLGFFFSPPPLPLDFKAKNKKKSPTATHPFQRLGPYTFKDFDIFVGGGETHISLFSANVHSFHLNSFKVKRQNSRLLFIR